LELIVFQKWYAKPLKTKNSREVANAAKLMFEEVGHKMNNLYTDRGNEFKNKIFKSEITDPRGMNHFFSYSTKKAPHSERAIRSLKQILYKMMSLKVTKNWVKLLDSVVDFMKQTRHISNSHNKR
jgi:hypothetical protein